jgi:hypothetical protein
MTRALTPPGVAALGLGIHKALAALAACAPTHPVPWNVKIKPDFFLTRWQKSQINFLKKAV